MGASKKAKAKRAVIGITKAIFLAIAEAIRIGEVAFSRRSFYEKNIMIHYGYLPWQINRTLARFEKSGYLKAGPRNTFKLSPRGRIQTLRYTVDDIQAPPRPDSWDWKWRLLIFDIPEEKKWSRDVLRDKLKEWHFAPLQLSVYISPFDCSEEFEKLLMILEVEPYVNIIVAEGIGAHLERHFVSHFNLLGLMKKSEERD